VNSNGPIPGYTITPSGTFHRLAVSRAVGEPVIEADALGFAFGTGEGRTPVLHDVGLDIDKGEIVILTGPSGSGKTTLLTLIGALRRIQEGSLSVLGRDLQEISRRGQVELRQEIGFIFQLHNLFSSLTALENVRMAAILRPGLQDPPEARCRELLGALGLGDRLRHLPARLSGGQRQRVAIARALVNRPRLVLADEPTASLDYESSGRVVELLRERASGPDKTTILIVTHDQRLLDRADRIIHMVDGCVVSNVVTGRVEQIVQTLMKVPELKGLSEATFMRVAERMMVEARRAGETIVTEGVPGDRYYLIGAGMAEAFRDGRRVRELRPGDSFGRITGLFGAISDETIRAKTDLELYVMPKEDVEQVMATDRLFEDRIRRIVLSVRPTL
jgi:putative ABC transport system ATP-binding protein